MVQHRFTNGLNIILNDLQASPDVTINDSNRLPAVCMA